MDDAGLQKEIGIVLTSFMQGYDEALLSKQQAELDNFFLFKWDGKASVEWNIYKFQDYLRMYAGACRRWEEHHNGTCCVVERVRDTYLMPKIKEFSKSLRNHFAAEQV